MGLFDKLNNFIDSIGLGEKKTSDLSKDQSKISKTSTGKSRQKLEKATASLGIDISPVINEPKIKSILVAHAKKSCSTIENIPQQYREKVAEAVLANFYGTLPDVRTLLAEIQSIYQMPKKEALLIARDQSSKLTARLDQARQEAIGIEEYIWRTVLSQCNHDERKGKKFRWDSPPSGGHPGQAYLCVCYAEAVTDINKIVSKALKAKK